MTISKRISLVIIVLITCISCDQSTKSVAESLLSDAGTFSFLGDSLRLQLAHNTGAFLSFGAKLPIALRTGLFSAGVGFMLLALLAYLLFSKSLSVLELIALSFLLAGGVGNLIDRIFLGYVVDFINIGIGPLRTGIFNVADIAVSAGALMLMFDAFGKQNAPRE